jgi:hypothetical protein
MAWDDRIISRETVVWKGHLPKDNIFSITKVHPGSIAHAASIEPGQYYYAGGNRGAKSFWRGLAVRGATGEVVSRIFDTARGRCVLLRTVGFPWGIRLEVPHFKLCDDLRRGLPNPDTIADRIMNAPEPFFRDLTEAALSGMARPHPKRVFLYCLGWLLTGHTRANEVIDEIRVAAATGAIAKGDVASAQKLLPEASRYFLVNLGASFAGLYMYTAGLIAAQAGKPRKEAANLLLGALQSLPDCERVKDALRKLGEPVPEHPKQAGRKFAIDYRLPVVDPLLTLPSPDCRNVGLFEELARLRTNQIALVVLLGGYRSNGFYSRSMEMLGHLYPVIRNRLGVVHVITSALEFSDKDRAFTERWMQGEAYAVTRGVPLVLLTDRENAVCEALRTTHSPSNYVLGCDGSVLVEGDLDDDGPIWEALAKLSDA